MAELAFVAWLMWAALIGYFVGWHTWMPMVTTWRSNADGWRDAAHEWRSLCLDLAQRYEPDGYAKLMALPLKGEIVREKRDA